MLKVLVSFNFTDHHKYFPGILPYYFYVYKHDIIDNEISLSIEKKSLFSKNKSVKKVKIVLNIKEMVLFEKGEEMCKTHYYYAKWTTFPIFIRNGDIFTIRFYFIETLLNNKTTFIQFDFGKAAQQLIGFNQGSAYFFK